MKSFHLNATTSEATVDTSWVIFHWKIALCYIILSKIPMHRFASNRICRFSFRRHQSFVPPIHLNDYSNKTCIYVVFSIRDDWRLKSYDFSTAKELLVQVNAWITNRFADQSSIQPLKILFDQFDFSLLDWFSNLFFSLLQMHWYHRENIQWKDEN